MYAKQYLKKLSIDCALFLVSIVSYAIMYLLLSFSIVFSFIESIVVIDAINGNDNLVVGIFKQHQGNIHDLAMIGVSVVLLGAIVVSGAFGKRLYKMLQATVRHE